MLLVLFYAIARGKRDACAKVDESVYSVGIEQGAWGMCGETVCVLVLQAWDKGVPLKLVPVDKGELWEDEKGKGDRGKHGADDGKLVDFRLLIHGHRRLDSPHVALAVQVAGDARVEGAGSAVCRGGGAHFGEDISRVCAVVGERKRLLLGLCGVHAGGVPGVTTGWARRDGRGAADKCATLRERRRAARECAHETGDVRRRHCGRRARRCAGEESLSGRVGGVERRLRVRVVVYTGAVCCI
jgi:hypothetical protein